MFSSIVPRSKETPLAEVGPPNSNYPFNGNRNGNGYGNGNGNGNFNDRGRGRAKFRGGLEEVPKGMPRGRYKRDAWNMANEPEVSADYFVPTMTLIQ
jgi:hypothetical protein